MLSEEDFKNAIATAIRKMRNAEKKSCEELAAHSDIDYSSLNLIENGKQSPKAYTLYKILLSLGTDICAVISKEGNRIKEPEEILISKISHLNDKQQEILLKFLNEFIRS